MERASIFGNAAFDKSIGEQCPDCKEQWVIFAEDVDEEGYVHCPNCKRCFRIDDDDDGYLKDEDF